MTESCETETYSAAVTEYLDNAPWLTGADMPWKIHARKIAQTLDKQLREKGEVQSALASSFDKAMFRLDSRRPKSPAEPSPSLNDSGPMGEESIFSHLDE